MRVALAQTSPAVATPGEANLENPFKVLQANLEDAEEWIRKASEGKADVIVLPEYCLQGLLNEGRHVCIYLLASDLADLRAIVSRLSIPLSI